MNKRGFTVIELMVVVALMAILIGISIPLMSNWQSSSQEKQAAQDILSSLRQARSLAITGNQTLQVVLDLDDLKITYGDNSLDLPETVKYEARNKKTDAWSDSGSLTVTFTPQGASDDTFYVRVNEDDALTVKIESKAIGTARL